ncbi:hypothetical protein NP233_g8691 [Leucocoprinus birnbaumii]|uniref:C2H2-type domain-containing protein n=1 Tax=Leucocoprinus birnbaumii TaxID=56174 RepID=A0AAD5VM32_9AGAR|nr:hypothetical protein NP233_g8691 [Leucocoprinus birnbaumii]
MDLSNPNETSPYINDVDVVPPSPPSGQRDLDFNQSPYLQDYNQDFGLGNSLGSPSFHDGSYYSPYSNHSELSFGGEHDVSLNVFDSDIGLGLRTEYDPNDFDAPQSSSLLIYQDNDFMPQYSTLTASKTDLRNSNSPYDYSSPSSNASGNEDQTADKRSRASSVSSNHANNNAYNASPRLDVAQSFEAMTFHSPGLTTNQLPSVSHSPAPPSQPLSPPRLVMPDDQGGDNQGPPKINAPGGDDGMGGPSFNIVPATPIGGGSSAANPSLFQGTLETLPQGSALDLQGQQWSTVGQQSATATNQSSNTVPKQEFTFPPQGALLGNSASTSGQVVDDSAIGASNFLFAHGPPRTRSKSENSPEQPTWDQSYLEQQRRLGALGGTAVVDDQTVNMNDVLPGTQQQPQLNPGFTFGAKPPTNFLSPDLNPIRRVKSDGVARPMHRQSRSEDIRGTGLAPPQPGHQHSQSSSGQFLFPPPAGQVGGFLSPNQQPFYGGSTGSPDGPLPSISAGRSGSPVRPIVSSPGHIRRASSGTRSERGAEAWSGGAALGPQHRVSPYPSPHASPRPRVNDLPSYDDYSGSNMGGGAGLLGVDGFAYAQQQQGYNTGYDMTGTYTPSSTGASAYHTPGQSPSPAPLTIEPSVPKPTVTTGRTANASHKRRKQDASFICPIPGCGSTFTRSFNLKGHIRSHKEEKPFVCHWPGCGKGPYHCDGCGKQFARMDALNRHLRSEGGADCQKLLKANGKIDPDSDTVKSEKMEGVKSAAVAL